MLTQEYLKECMKYDLVNGGLIWKTRPTHHFKSERAGKSWNTRYSGTVVGTPHCRGYVAVNFSGSIYLVHRLVWLYIYGEMPKFIDHIDGCRTNNRISNLREVTPSQNSRNMAKPENNTSGIVGVCRNQRDFEKPWRARIKVDRKDLSLGYFDSFEDAVKARKSAEIFYGFHPNHGR